MQQSSKSQSYISLSWTTSTTQKTTGAWISFEASVISYGHQGCGESLISTSASSAGTTDSYLSDTCPHLERLDLWHGSSSITYIILERFFLSLNTTRLTTVTVYVAMFFVNPFTVSSLSQLLHLTELTLVLCTTHVVQSISCLLRVHFLECCPSLRTIDIVRIETDSDSMIFTAYPTTTTTTTTTTTATAKNTKPRPGRLVQPAPIPHQQINNNLNRLEFDPSYVECSTLNFIPARSPQLEQLRVNNTPWTEFKQHSWTYLVTYSRQLTILHFDSLFIDDHAPTLGECIASFPKLEPLNIYYKPRDTERTRYVSNKQSLKLKPQQQHLPPHPNSDHHPLKEFQTNIFYGHPLDWTLDCLTHCPTHLWNLLRRSSFSLAYKIVPTYRNSTSQSARSMTWSPTQNHQTTILANQMDETTSAKTDNTTNASASANTTTTTTTPTTTTPSPIVLRYSKVDFILICADRAYY
ncbi:MAG: hypothetical protein J3R72DRAFT_496877 [Linnemannia gamsii]|nr:MAG: hypothetical protein J3R72DRAFT_496877 [Linnemannia gamsii]